MLECLDNKGYLEESIETIASYFGTDTEIVEDLLSDLQALDPSGVCARTLEECLKLQLERRDMLPGNGCQEPDSGHCQEASPLSH